jgi:hypothetical protein
MFKAIKDNKIIAISDTDSTFPCLVCDAIANEPEHTTADYVHVDGQFVLTTSDPAIEQRKQEVRSIRNNYLEQTDKYLSVSDFPIDDETKEQYRLYRQYLRDYTLEDEWWLANPKTFDEWYFKTSQKINEL